MVVSLMFCDRKQLAMSRKVEWNRTRMCHWRTQQRGRGVLQKWESPGNGDVLCAHSFCICTTLEIIHTMFVRGVCRIIPVANYLDASILLWSSLVRALSQPQLLTVEHLLCYRPLERTAKLLRLVLANPLPVTIRRDASARLQE
jgi:hypothetical protein